MGSRAPKVAAREIQEPPDAVDRKAETLAHQIRNSKHFIVFTGAGISTSAGKFDYSDLGRWTEIWPFFSFWFLFSLSLSFFLSVLSFSCFLMFCRHPRLPRPGRCVDIAGPRQATHREDHQHTASYSNAHAPCACRVTKSGPTKVSGEPELRWAA
jgi:hypothetical protein